MRRGAITIVRGFVLPSTGPITRTDLLRVLTELTAQVDLVGIGNEEIADVGFDKIISGTLGGTKVLTLSGAAAILKSLGHVRYNPVGPIVGVGFGISGDGKIYCYGGEWGGSLRIGSYIQSITGAIVFGSLAGKQYHTADGDSGWGQGSAAIGILHDGKFFGGGANFDDAIVTIDAAGNFVVANTNTSDHYINIGAIDTTIAAPILTPSGGAFSGTLAVSMKGLTQGSRVYYTMTTDGSTPATPTTASTLYPDAAVPVTVDGTKIKAVAYKMGEYSAIVSATFANNAAIVPNPLINPLSGIYNPSTGTLTVYLTDTLLGSSIRFTTDGSTPSDVAGTLIAPASGGVVPSGSVVLPVGTKTVKAIAFKAGKTNSAVVSNTYTVRAGGSGYAGGVGGGGGGGVRYEI